MIILLVILPALVSGAREKIDWTKCVDSACFCGDANDPPKLVRPGDNVEGCEKVGVLSQFFTENSALFLFQLAVEPTDPVLSVKVNPRITLMYGSTKLFGCEYNRMDGKVILSGDEKLIFNYKIKLFEEKFEERSYLDEGIAVCAVTVESVSKFNTKEIKLSSLAKKVKIIWTSGDSDVNAKLFEAMVIDNFLFQSSSAKCNPAFKSLLNSPDYYVEPIRNTDRFNLNCDNYGASYTMRYEKAGDIKEMKELKCTKNAADVYSYSIDTGKKDANDDVVLIDVPDPESYSIFCTAKFEELCENPNKCTKAEDPNCPDYEAGSKDKSANLTCAENKWKIRDEYYVLKDQPACKRNTVLKANGASFIAVLTSGQSVPITKELNARCFTDWDCMKKSKLDIPNSGWVVISEAQPMVMSCNDTEALMTVYHRETNQTFNDPQSYTCNTTSGEFYNGNVIVPPYSQVRCRINRTNFQEKAEANISEKQVIVIVCGAAALILLAVIGLVIGGFCCWRHRNDININNLNALNRNKLAAKCMKDFGHVLKASSLNAYLIVDGLKMIDKMLEMEVDDPKAWEEAYKFLTRFHGSIMRTDFQVWHMFSRYCHLQAKKIIDKHGWRTETPITKDNPKGIIRCVAVKLLGYCISDHEAFEAEEYIEIGFRRLGLEGASQYPHCGLLWSLIGHTRRGKYERFAVLPNLVAGFMTERFCNMARQIACKKVQIAIPDKEVIPEFGSVAAQAAYALGGVPCHSYLVSNTTGILFGTKDLAAACAPTVYMRGMCESRGIDPAQIVLETCHMWPKLNEDFLARMNLLASESEWHAVWKDAFQQLAFYGRDLDIRRLHSRFMLNDTSTDFLEIHREQSNFEKALDDSLEDVRKWLAKHTDRAEFKKKPAPPANSKLKLRDYEFDDGGVPVGRCSGSDKSGGGKPAAADKSAASKSAAAPVIAAGATAAAALPTAPLAAAPVPAAGSPGAAPAAVTATAQPPIAAAAAVPTAPIAPTPTP